MADDTKKLFAKPAGMLAYSYYYGYLNLVLKSLGGRVSKSQGGKWKDMPIKKMIILCPESGTVPSRIDKLDSRITVVGKADAEVVDQAGQVQRAYPQTVYNINVNGKEVPFIAEFPAIVKVFENLANDVSLTGYQASNITRDMKEFSDCLRTVLSREAGLQDTFLVVEYNDKTKKLGDLITEILTA